MGNDQKIVAIQYDWETVSLDAMKKNYFERIINIFSMFEIVVAMELVRTTFVDTKRNHITALLAHADTQIAWVKEYGYEPSSEDIETLYNLLKFIEAESAQNLSMNIESAVAYFNEHHDQAPDYIMSSKSFCIHEWAPDVLVKVNGLVVHIDYDQRAIAIMHQKTFDDHNLAETVQHEALSLAEMSLLMKTLTERDASVV